MGNGSSSDGGRGWKRSDAEVVSIMMPVFFVREDVSKEDAAIAIESWDLILNDTSPYFLEKRGSPGFEQASCIMFFYDAFYSRLFDVHPVCFCFWC